MTLGKSANVTLYVTPASGFALSEGKVLNCDNLGETVTSGVWFKKVNSTGKGDIREVCQCQPVCHTSQSLPFRGLVAMSSPEPFNGIVRL